MLVQIRPATRMIGGAVISSMHSKFLTVEKWFSNIAISFERMLASHGSTARVCPSIIVPV